MLKRLWFAFVVLMSALVPALIPASASADPQFKLLVVAMPSKYHYEYIPVARDGLERLAKLHSFDLTFITNGWQIEQDLSQYAAIMLLNTPTEELTPVQRKKIEDYVNGGGHVMIVHRAAISLPVDSWLWHEKLVGRTIGVHPMVQTGVVTVADKGFPATFGLPERWMWSDEFYTFTNPHNVDVNVVLKVDEASYDPRKIWPGQVSEPMGDHPIAWYHHVGKSRVFVTTLGHNGEMYRDPQYLLHLMGGIYWTATGLGQAQQD